MKRLLCFTLVLTAVTIPAAAQKFGELFPLTNTRYRAAFGGAPKLVANDNELFLFWAAETKVRATRLNDNEPRAGHVVLEQGSGYDVAWMGDRFLALSTRGLDTLPATQQIFGQYLDADAQPTGPSFSIIGNAVAPRIARGPSSSLLVYRTNNEVRSLILGPDGRKITSADSQSVSLFGLKHAVAATDNGFVAAVIFANQLRSIAMDRNGNKISEQSLARGDAAVRLYRDVAIASNGTSYLAVWSSNAEVVAATIDENGAIGAPLVLETQGNPTEPAVAWNGAGWTVAFSMSTPQKRARVVQLDFAGQRIEAAEERVDASSPAVVALDGRIVAAWRRSDALEGSVSVLDLPLAQNTPRVVTYTATKQTLLATASSSEATLVVWREEFDGDISVHAGVRTHDGRWTERELASGPVFSQFATKEALAASDGHNFAVAVSNQQTATLHRLDGDGQPTSEPLPLPRKPLVMAWNGTHYAMIGTSTEAFQLSGMLAGPSGALAASVVIPDVYFHPTVLLSDGNGFLLAGEYNECQFLLCATEAPYGTRLGPGLQRLDPQDIELSTEGGTNIVGGLWNGSEYVLVWNREHGIRLTRVAPAPGGSFTTSSSTLTFNGQDLIALRDGSMALVGTEQHRTVVATLRADGTVFRKVNVDDFVSAGREPFLAPLPDGMALLASRINEAAPHHGTSHVMMAIARSTPPPRPDAPHVSARIEGNDISIDWSASSGTINGYRIEYRVDDGSWNEIDGWFSPGAQHTSIRKPDFGTRFAFRMRAFNDAGASEYSATTLTNPSRRRAVR